MSNIINQNGLQINSLSQITTDLEDKLKQIYGSNINLDQNTPDGQLINILAQILVDYGELLQDINAGFDPDQAVGVILDQRCKINGITRKEGKYTTCTVNVTFDGSATLKGVDLYSVEDCFQVQDTTGNILVPVTTTSGVSGNTLSITFRAKEYGALTFAAGTITTITTPLSGVASVTNLATTTSNVGYDEESDTELRIRREIISKQLNKFGGIDSLKNALYDLSTNIEYAGIEENTGNTVDSNGIPAHGIWIIIKGSADLLTNIANVIYNYRIAGTPMKYLDDESSSSSSSSDIPEWHNVPIERPDGRIFTAHWSEARNKEIYCTVTCFIKGQALDTDNVKTIISENINPDVREDFDTTQIASVLLDKIDNIVITELQISTDNTNWVTFLQSGTSSYSVDEYITIPTSKITVTEYHQ